MLKMLESSLTRIPVVVVSFISLQCLLAEALTCIFYIRINIFEVLQFSSSKNMLNLRHRNEDQVSPYCSVNESSQYRAGWGRAERSGRGVNFNF